MLNLIKSMLFQFFLFSSSSVLSIGDYVTTDVPDLGAEGLAGDGAEGSAADDAEGFPGGPCDPSVLTSNFDQILDCCE